MVSFQLPIPFQLFFWYFSTMTIYKISIVLGASEARSLCQTNNSLLINKRTIILRPVRPWLPTERRVFVIPDLKSFKGHSKSLYTSEYLALDKLSVNVSSFSAWSSSPARQRHCIEARDRTHHSWHCVKTQSSNLFSD